MSLLILENIVKEYRNQCILNGVTPMEKYQEYNELLKEVERLYCMWDELIQ